MKIKSIKKIDMQPVYNMEVEKHHNFAVNGGNIVHNCDALRYQLIMKTAPSKQIDVKPKRDSIQESYAESVSNWNNYY